MKGVTKVTATLVIAAGGAVESVSFSGLAATTKLEACLAGIMKIWKFDGIDGRIAFTMVPPQ